MGAGVIPIAFVDTAAIMAVQVKLLKELSQRPANRQVVVDKPDFHLELRRNESTTETT